MNTSMKRVLFWTPRVLCILFAMFVSVFAALDIFSEGYGFIVALLLSLVPTFIVVIVLVIAWRWEWIGAILFIASALFLLAPQVCSGRRFIFPMMIIPGLLFLIGTLFLINWVYRAELRSR